MRLVQPENTVKYDVKTSDTLSSIALRYNTTPTELSRLNHLASSLLFPGQTLFVPEGQTSPLTEQHQIPLNNIQARDRFNPKSLSFSYTPRSPDKIISPRLNSLSPDLSLEDLLVRQDSEEEVSRRYLRIKAKYITDGQGVVSGVLLITPQTIMFNPSVSDHLVMDRGREAYLVRLPLKALSIVTLFEEISAMVSDDMTKQYIPVNYEQYRPFSPPRPGLIVCQQTGEEYAIPESNSPSSFTENKQTILRLAEQHLKDVKLKENSDTETTSDNPGKVSSIPDTVSSSNNSDTGTNNGDDTKSQRSNETDDNDKCKKELGSESCSNESTASKSFKMKDIDLGCGSDHGIGSMTDPISSDTLMNSTSGDTSSTPTLTSQNEDWRSSSPLLLNENEKKDDIVFNDSVQSSSTPKHTYSQDNGELFTSPKDLHLDLKTRKSEQMDTSNKMMKGPVGVVSRTFDSSKDSGFSEMTRSHSTTENIDIPRDLNRSALSEEARKWLGKHSVSLEQESMRSPEIEPRPAAEFHDPLMYVSIKVSKRFWCPAIPKHNAIMGIPPNRDQKRRQHWFAIPREKVDQFYGFVVHWLPDLSGVSTPSSEGTNEIDEGLNIVDDTFGKSSPASTFGWEKLNQEDAASMKLRVGSIRSCSSKASLRSLDDEPETSNDSQLLTKDQLKYLSRSLPSVTVGHYMELVYSTIMHGISLNTLYRNFESFDCPSLLVVRDEQHKTFGAFLSDPPAISDGFYGTGECMLFSFANEKTVKTYKWSGENSFFIKGSKKSLTVGGGRGVLGLWLDEDLYHGRTHSCSTFNNEVLSENEDFICTGLEAWAFV